MDHSATVISTTTSFLEQLGLGSSVSVQTNYDPDADSYQVLLETSDPGLVIGYHGESLSALQHFLSLHLYSQTSKWLNVSLNVNDYRQRRESAVFVLADSTAAKVIATGKPYSLPPMPALERRLVHLRLADHPQVTTASVGVGRTRSVIIAPKTADK